MPEQQQGSKSPEHNNANDDIHFEVGEELFIAMNAKFVKTLDKWALVVSVKLLGEHSPQL
jgi:hypothetical protein